MIAENDSGQKSEAFCSLPTYDVTLPGGRFQEQFLSTSNPDVLKGYVTVYEDSELVETQVGVGYGKQIYGDQIIPWNHIDLDHNHVDDNFGENIFLLFEYFLIFLFCYILIWLYVCLQMSYNMCWS